MSINFRKSLKIMPGVRLNIGKNGVSTSIGVKGAKINIGKKGTYLNTGIPGSGLSIRNKISSSKKEVINYNTEKTEVPFVVNFIAVLYIIFSVIMLFYGTLLFWILGTFISLFLIGKNLPTQKVKPIDTDKIDI